MKSKTDKAEKSISPLISLALASFLTPFMGSSVNLALPAMGRDFGLSAVGLGWVANSYLLSAAAGLVPLGRLADIHGRRRMFLLGLCLFSLTSFLTALTPSFFLLIALRLIQGLGGAMIFATGTAIITQIFSEGRRGWALGWSVGATYAGLSLGPTLGGFLIHLSGWRSLFFLTPLLGIASLILGQKISPDIDTRRGEPFDLAGSLLYALSLISLIYGLSRLPRVLGIIPAAAGAFILLSFIIIERAHPYPVLDIKSFLKRPAYGYSNLAALIHYMATAALGFLLSLYLQQVRGLTPVMAGLLLAIQPVIMALLSPFFGRLSDKAEPRILSSIGMGFSALGLLSFALISQNAPFCQIILGLIFVGWGFALFSSPNTNAIMSSAPPQALGTASATLAAMRLLGQMLSLGLVTMLLSVFMNSAEVTPLTLARFFQAYKVALTLFTILCSGGIFASLARGDIRRQ